MWYEHQVFRHVVTGDEVTLTYECETQADGGSIARLLPTPPGVSLLDLVSASVNARLDLVPARVSR